MQNKIELILLIIFVIIIPFIVSVWLFLTSGVVNEFLMIIFSNNKLLGTLLLSFLWIGGIGKVSEFIRQHHKNS
ncbi:MAG: hypothetical protein QM487_15105 [Candidatus Marithrix sp.]